MRIGPTYSARPARVLTVVHARAQADGAATNGAIEPVAPIGAIAERLPETAGSRRAVQGAGATHRPAGYGGWSRVSAPFVAQTIATLVDPDAGRPGDAGAYARAGAALGPAKGRTLAVA